MCITDTDQPFTRNTIQCHLALLIYIDLIIFCSLLKHYTTQDLESPHVCFNVHFLQFDNRQTQRNTSVHIWEHTHSGVVKLVKNSRNINKLSYVWPDTIKGGHAYLSSVTFRNDYVWPKDKRHVYPQSISPTSSGFQASLGMRAQIPST